MKAINTASEKLCKIGSVIGGISKEKQKRILSYFPEILVATPGRLWDFIENEGDPYLETLKDIEYLVLDEADRMIELGHFDELDKILEKVYMKGETYHDKELIEKALNQPKQKSSIGYDKKFSFINDMTEGVVIEVPLNKFHK